MTPAERKQRALEFARAMDRGDSDALDQLTAPSFIFRVMGSAPGMPGQMGREQFVFELPKLVRKMVPDGFNFDFDTAIAEGPHVSLQGTSDGSTASGGRYVNCYHWYFHFDGDKIDECREFLDVYAVMQSLDLATLDPAAQADRTVRTPSS